MTLYGAALFIHIMGAIVLVGMGFFTPIVMRGLARTPTTQGLREWAAAMQKITRLGNPAAVFVLVTGLYMAWREFSFTDGWIAVSLVLFVVLGAMAGGVLDPFLKNLVAAADAAPDGPVTDDLRAMIAAPKMHNFEAVLFGFDLAIVFMMTNKPGIGGALAATAVGLLVSGVLIARRARGRHSAALPA